MKTIIFFYLCLGVLLAIYTMTHTNDPRVRNMPIIATVLVILMWPFLVGASIRIVINRRKAEEEPTKEDLEAIARAKAEDPSETISLEEYKKQRGDIDV